MKKLIPLLLLLGIVCGCHSGQNDTATSQTGKTRQDSLALKVALMPTLDCLPFYYAQRCGLFKELGLDIRLQTFNAQMDCDTAFARRHVDVSYTDLIRAAWMQSKGTGLYVFMQADGHHELLTAKSRRIRQTKHLKERMVAMARHSVTDLLLDTVIGQARLEPSTVYHPQINDIRLRYGMLNNATIDAAFLPEPYASQAERT
jgi:NitT/TauT family transport system substrate-binding protein